MKTSESIIKISAALLKAQKEIGAAKKGSANPFFKSKYADLGSVMQACKAELNKNGISVLQPVGVTDNGGQYVETILLHGSGEFISNRMKLDIPKKRVAPKDGGEPYLSPDPQAQGSAITYARRYSLQSIMFIPGEDDDGEKAMQRKVVSNDTYDANKNPDAYDRAMANEKCKDCGSPKVRNPKTSKWFCKSKCWTR